MRIAIIDDQRILAEGLKMLLGSEPDIEVLGIGENGQEAVELAKAMKPDIMLIDIQMPVMNGVEAIKQISRACPSVKCVILTTFMDDDYIYEGLSSGAVGYLLKDASPQEIAKALRVVDQGGALIEPHVAAKMISRFTALSEGALTDQSKGSPQGSSAENQPVNVFSEITERELEIVKLVSEGLSNVEIAETLFITEGTVKNNLTRVLQKLELRDRTQLAIHYIKWGRQQG